MAPSLCSVPIRFLYVVLYGFQRCPRPPLHAVLIFHTVHSITVPHAVRPHLSKGQELVQRPDGVDPGGHPVAGGSLFFALPALLIADVLCQALQRLYGLLEDRDALCPAHTVDGADALAFFSRRGKHTGSVIPVCVVPRNVQPCLGQP